MAATRRHLRRSRNAHAKTPVARRRRLVLLRPLPQQPTLSLLAPERNDLRQKTIRAAQQIGRIDHRAIAEKKSIFLIERGHDYKIVINGKTNFQPFCRAVGASDYAGLLTITVKGQPQPASTTSCGLSTSLTAEASLPRRSTCRFGQSLQNCNVWQDKFQGDQRQSNRWRCVLSVSLRSGGVRRRATPGDSECLLLSVSCETRTLVRCRYRLRNHKSRRGLWSIAFGIPPFTPKANVQDCRIGRQVRNSPIEILGFRVSQGLIHVVNVLPPSSDSQTSISHAPRSMFGSIDFHSTLISAQGREPAQPSAKSAWQNMFLPRLKC